MQPIEKYTHEQADIDLAEGMRGALYYSEVELASAYQNLAAEGLVKTISQPEFMKRFRNNVYTGPNFRGDWRGYEGNVPTLD